MARAKHSDSLSTLNSGPGHPPYIIELSSTQGPSLCPSYAWGLLGCVCLVCEAEIFFSLFLFFTFQAIKREETYHRCSGNRNLEMFFYLFGQRNQNREYVLSYGSFKGPEPFMYLQQTGMEFRELGYNPYKDRRDR